ncbi:MAG: hypothetical protein M3145_04785 [Pseudomonadota bacterium]|nr:hypothetical protein [Pseudomonadota bacterium]
MTYEEGLGVDLQRRCSALIALVGVHHLVQRIGPGALFTDDVAAIERGAAAAVAGRVAEIPTAIALVPAGSSGVAVLWAAARVVSLIGTGWAATLVIIVPSHARLLCHCSQLAEHTGPVRVTFLQPTPVLQPGLRDVA